MQPIAFIVSRVSNKTNYLNFEYGKHLHINRVQNWKEATTRFPKAKYAVNNNMSVVHIFIINNVQQPASYICISVEHHWFSLLIRCNSDPESLKHDISLMKVYIHKCLTTSNFLATPLYSGVFFVEAINFLIDPYYQVLPYLMTSGLSIDSSLTF